VLERQRHGLLALPGLVQLDVDEGWHQPLVSLFPAANTDNNINYFPWASLGDDRLTNPDVVDHVGRAGPHLALVTVMARKSLWHYLAFGV
jgi:hypothetical protein